MVERDAAGVVTLPAAPAWYGPATLGLAGFAGLALVGRPAGLGLSLLLLGLVTAATRLDQDKRDRPFRLAGAAESDAADARQDKRDRPFCLAWLGAAGVLAVVPTLRTAGWVVALSVLGCVGLCVVAVARVETWGRLFTAPARWLVALVPGPVVAVALAGRGSSHAVLRGLVGAALLVALFGSLLVAADAAFAQLADDLLPDLAGTTGWRIALAVLVAAVAGALAIVAVLPAAEARPAPEPLVGVTEARIALGALVGLFAAFVAVQAATLFGGDAFVQRTSGLTYAQYAREGFALLLVVAALTLAVIAAAVRHTRADRRLLGALCVLTVVILASAWHRLDLYQDAYGATRAREFAAWSIAWLAGLFALVLARRAGPRAVITWSAVVGVAFGLSNPDARIAKRAQDPAYARSLSDDAGLRCVDRGGGVLSVTLAELRHGCRQDAP